MKRSEIVNLIYHELLEPGHEFNTPEDEHLKWKANDLLISLEKAGMLPPLQTPKYCYCSLRGQCPKCFPSDYTEYNYWSDENEA